MQASLPVVAACPRDTLSGIRRSGIVLVLLLASRPTAARAQWAIEGFLGSAASAHSTLTIEQVGQPTLSFTAHYATKPTEPWIYYAFRISHWWGKWGGMAGVVHHKIYLENNPPEVQAFKVTNGYNLVGIGPAYRAGAWTLFGTIGPVLSNPASTVRGLSDDQQRRGVRDRQLPERVQRAAGGQPPVLSPQLGVRDDRPPALRRLGEYGGRRTGSADTPNYAVHVLVGLGAGSSETGQHCPAPTPAP